MASNKKQIYVGRSQTLIKNMEYDQLQSWWGGFVLIKSVTVTSSWAEDKYGPIKAKEPVSYRATRLQNDT